MKQEQDVHKRCIDIFNKEFYLIELEIAKDESLISCENIDKKIKETKNWIKEQKDELRNSKEWAKDIAEEYGIELWENY